MRATDVEEERLTYSIVAPPAYGTLLGAAPEVRYVPDANYFGDDSFTFVANDGQDDSAPAAISLAVFSEHDAPVGDPQNVTTAEDTALEITLTATDPDSSNFTFRVYQLPEHGVLSGSGANLNLYSRGESGTANHELSRSRCHGTACHDCNSPVMARF